MVTNSTIKTNELILTNNALWYFKNTIMTYFSFFENQYFLFLGLIQLSTDVILPANWSPTGRWSTIIPLLFCVLIELLLVYKSYFNNKRLEKRYNSKMMCCLNKEKNTAYTMKRCDELQVGDLLICEINSTLPVDALLIEPNVCEISTIKINGENNLRYVNSIDDNFNSNDFSIEIFNLNSDVIGELTLQNNVTAISKNSFIQNGSIVKSMAIVYVLAVGNQKKKF